jgi:hypothetical protein
MSSFANSLTSVVTRIATEFKTVRSEKANTANTLAGYGITDAYTKSETDSVISTGIAAVVNAAPGALDTLSELATALGNDANFSTTLTTSIGLKANTTYVNTALGLKANTANTLAGYGITDAYTRSQTDGAISQATSGLALSNKIINLQAPTNPSTTAVIAPALSTMGTTNGYVVNLSFGNFDEPGPIVFNEKWQLQVVGPAAASTTAVTIKNGVTIQNSNGVRFTRVQIEGTSSISCRAGLGHHFERDQFIGPLTLGGTGGFMMFTDCDFAGNVTISPTFAGVVYFIRCAFSGASAVYTFGQSSSLQAIVIDCSGVPNTGFVSGATSKASYSGSIVYKNNSQAQFINNIPVTTIGAANNQVLKYNGVAFAPANDSVTDTTKLALAGGTMTGAIAMSNNKITGLGAPTANTDAATKVYVDSAVANVSGGSANTDGLLQLTGGTMTGLVTLSGAPTANLHAATKAYVDSSISTATIVAQETVEQVGHGFDVLDAVYHNGTIWASAQADAGSTVAQGIVAEVIDADNFRVVTHGLVTIATHGLTLGHYYWLSQATASAIAEAQPTSGIVQSVLHVRSADEVLVNIGTAISI